MTALLAQAGLLPANLDALVPVALVSLLVWREVRRAEAGPASEPAPRRADRLIVPLLALFAIVVVLELVRML
ncbi:MAG: hypothetical protein E6G10_15515 [Actinobacteria bacterium]|nr:MAG: hypothetical protein E6G10_15515 [Actinomycetota bacterium]